MSKKLKLTIEMTYDAPSEYYGTDSIEEMIAIDTRAFQDHELLLGSLSMNEYTFSIEEVTNESSATDNRESD